MLNKDKFLQIVTECDLDEVWVNFSNPFDEVHDKQGEEVFACKWDTSIVSTSKITGLLMSFFAPKFDSDEEKDVLSVGLWCRVVNTENVYSKERFAQEKERLRLIYRKGEGLIG